MVVNSPTSLLAAMLGGVIFVLVVISFKSLVFWMGRWWRWAEERTQAYQCFEIPQRTEGGEDNPLYRRAATYVAALPSLEHADSAMLFSSGRKPNDFFLLLGPGHSAADSFLGARVSWTNVSGGGGGGSRLVLRLRRQDRTRFLRPYLQHVESVADDLEFRRRDIRLYTLSGGGPRWRSVSFTHPASMETVAMDADLKSRIRADLESFLKGRAYYHRLGRVWRRSYLLYGPPGTGKSTFVAAMAKLLCYDIYDVDLSRVSADSTDLKALLLGTTPRSVILVEDLDRHLKRKGGVGEEGDESRLTRILNFMDGVFSCCGEERVMVFTMNSDDGGGMLEAVEPAVLRPGRLDVHIHFPLCDFTAFKTLANSYLGLKDHKLYPQVEEVFQSGARISPAEVGEIMIANRASPSRALKSVISTLQQQHAPSAARISGAASRRQLSDGGGAWSRSEHSAGDASNAAMGFGKEFKKLYGLIRMRSGSKKEGPVPVEFAAAAGTTPLDQVDKR